MARALYLTAASNREAVKPEPPADLHARMEQELRDLGSFTDPIPKNAWTRDWLTKGFNLSETQANRRLKKLIELGRVKKIGRRRYDFYYVFTDDVDGQRQPGPKSPR